MRLQRLLLIALAAIITIAVIGAFLVTLADTDKPRGVDEPPGDSTAPTERTFPDPPPIAPPTTDLFGNRLEMPNDEAGVPLSQDPATRPDPNRLDYLTAAPARIQWQRGWNGAALPISGSDGPTRVDEGIATGFAHTPQGAAMAAIDALARVLAAPEGIWQRVVADRYYGASPALIDRFGASRARTPDVARYVVVPDGIRVAPGYREDLAVVQVASRSTDGYAISTWPMVWIDGDWRVRVPYRIETLWDPGTPASTLAGFGSWKGRP